MQKKNERSERKRIKRRKQRMESSQTHLERFKTVREEGCDLEE